MRTVDRWFLLLDLRSGSRVTSIAGPTNRSVMPPRTIPVLADSGSMDHWSDEDLVAEAQRELPYRTVAFDVLVRRHYDAVRRFAATLLGGVDEADALAQDVMLRVFGSLKTFRGDARFTTWLYRIVENLARTRLHQLRRETSKREAFGATLAEVMQDPETEAEGFAALMASLTADERTLLAFRFLEDLELHEIADVLGLGLSAVKMRYYRTLDKLKRTLPPELN